MISTPAVLHWTMARLQSHDLRWICSQSDTDAPSGKNVSLKVS